MAEPATPLTQPTAYDAAGNPIATEALPDALAQGRAFYAKGARVLARNDRGDLVSVDASEVNHPSIRVLTPEEVAEVQEHKEFGKGIGNQAKAFGAGAARTLTFGLSDVAARGLGGSETAHSLEALKKQNPYSSAAGEIAGAVAPLLLSGGTSAAAEGAAEGAEVAQTGGLLAKAGEAARAATIVPRTIAKAGHLVEHGIAHGLHALGYEGSTLAGRIGAQALKLGVGGAVEGGLYGAQGAISEAALQDKDQTVENFVGGLGHGALLGFGIGATLGAAGEVGSALASKALGAKKGALEHLRNDQALRTIGTDAQIKKLAGRSVGTEAEEKIQLAGEELSSYKIKTGELKGQPLLEAGDNADRVLEKLNVAKREVGAAKGGVLEQLDAHIAEAPELAPNVKELTDRIRSEVVEPLQARAKMTPGLRQKVRAVERELGGLDQRAAMIEYGKAPPMTFGELDAWRQDLREIFQPAKPQGGGIPSPPPKSAKYLEQAERTAADFIKEKASNTLRAMGEDAETFNDLNRQYSAFSKLEAMAQRTVNRGRRILSPSSYGTGLGAALMAIVSGHPVGAMAIGAVGALGNKLAIERGNSVIAAMARSATETEGTIERAAHHLADKTVEGTGVLAALHGEEHGPSSGVHEKAAHHEVAEGSLQERYEKTAQRVKELAEPSDAHAVVTGLTTHVTDQYPELGASAGQKLLQVYQHLKEQLPVSSSDPRKSITPLAIKERVSPLQMRDFLATVRGATNPKSVIADLARGKLDRKALDSFKTVYPKTFGKLREKVAETVGSRDTELPYRRRVFLSMAFDFTGDQTLEPQTLQGIQQVFPVMQATGETQQSDQPTHGPIDAAKVGGAMRLEHSAKAG